MQLEPPCPQSPEQAPSNEPGCAHALVDLPVGLGMVAKPTVCTSVVYILRRDPRKLKSRHTIHIQKTGINYRLLQFK